MSVQDEHDKLLQQLAAHRPRKAIAGSLRFATSAEQSRLDFGACLEKIPGVTLFPTLGVGFLDFELNSSPHPELFPSPGLLPAHAWSAQPQSVLGVPRTKTLRKLRLSEPEKTE